MVTGVENAADFAAVFGAIASYTGESVSVEDALGILRSGRRST